MDRISDEERLRIAELLADGAPVWRLHQAINRSRYAIRRAVIALQRPARREPKRSPLRLSLAEREEISRGLAAGESVRRVARGLGRAPSTVCREVAANGGPGRYRACAADRRAVRLAHRRKPAKLAQCPRLRKIVEGKLMLRWSPEQIAGWLKASYPDDPEMRVSHETIYLSLFVQSRGALRKELARYLRRGRARRRPRGLAVMNGQGQLRGTVHISQRPAEANDRAVPGHWEGDLLFGTRSSTVATLVERKSRFVMLVRLPGGHTADAVTDAWPGRSPRCRPSCAGPSPGTKARKWPSTPVSAWPLACRPASATRTRLGSAAATRTPTACSASISPAAPTSERSRRVTSTTSLPNSTTALDKRSDGSHHVRH
jgi:IS30 family transposase